ncbi:putative UDP-2,3-diacylglucosamine pyrophosphatase LpxI [Hyphomicrobiales bacterium]|nr:putative UDP-2,3-diacylglucosamine pyrophosphatase LpxI [Hyphomicrobiales bacterium]CAH1663599.1 putative UDP-2,3-diacylglucosamine pyrophosphatase LpxI [Hyphomicrobiales bacterium]
MHAARGVSDTPAPTDLKADDAGAPVVLLAGGGALPDLLAAALERRGRAVRILAFRGFAERALARRADLIVDLIDYKRTLSALKAWKPAEIVLIGTVTRPKPIAFMGALSAYRNREEIAAILGSGDDGLLGGVVRLIEEEGFAVAGIDQLAPELLAPQGQLGAVAPDSDSWSSIARGLAVLDSLSPFDVGQASVICAHWVAAIEGPEGTDAMLRRVQKLRRGARLRATHGGVLVKTAKRDQDLRVDLPTIGPRTVVRAAAAGLQGIAVGAKTTLIVEIERTVQEADRRGLFLLGVDLPHGSA